MIGVAINASAANVVNNGTIDITDGSSLNVINGANFNNGASGTLGVVADANTHTAYGISGSGTPNKLAGTLDVTTVGTPSPGDTFAVVVGSTRTGSFATVNSAVSYTLHYVSTGLTLTS